MPAFVNASNVRAYAGVNGIDAPWTESNLGSNIRAASSYLQRRTGRQFEVQLATSKTFTTNGEAFVSIPDLRSASGISLAGSSLTADTSYWLIPDTQQTGVFLGIQFRPFGSQGNYRGFPDWFDTNKDSWRFGLYGSQPNDLTITGDWGWEPLPEDLIHATKVLAAWYTRRPDALLGGVTVTAQGTEIDLSAIPAEVRSFIEEWKVGGMVETVR